MGEGHTSSDEPHHRQRKRLEFPQSGGKRGSSEGKNETKGGRVCKKSNQEIDVLAKLPHKRESLPTVWVGERIRWWRGKGLPKSRERRGKSGNGLGKGSSRETNLKGVSGDVDKIIEKKEGSRESSGRHRL